MASSAAARAVCRSCAAPSSAFRLASEAKVSCSPFRLTSTISISNRSVRCAAPLSACMKSMLPYHTVTASALMTSMLSISRRSYGWLPEVTRKICKSRK